MVPALLREGSIEGLRGACRGAVSDTPAPRGSAQILAARALGVQPVPRVFLTSGKSHSISSAKLHLV